MNYDNIPQELRKLSNWVLFRREQRPNQKKHAKIPYDPKHRNRKASTTDPATWGTFEQTLNAYGDLGTFDGIGFVVTPPYVFIDLDGCLNPESGDLTPESREIVTSLRTFTEKSVSGTGLHPLCTTTKPLPEKGRRNGFVEIYSGDRFVAMTGELLPGTPPTIEDRTDAIHELYARLFGAPRELPPTPPPSGADFDIEERLTKARSAKNGDRFARLMAGDVSMYPDAASPDGNHSRADLALCSMLAYWLDRDAAKIDAAFRTSGLMRDKWNDRHGSETYGQRTIRKARESCRSTYGESVKTKSQREAARIASFGPTNHVESSTVSVGGYGFRLTDTGNAEQLVARFGESIRYCPALKAWFIWDGKRWVVDEKQQIRGMARNTIQAMFDQAEELGNQGQREALAKHAHQSESAARQSAMVTLAEVLVPIGQEELDARTTLFNCANGTIDLTTGMLLPHRRDDMLTRMTPIDYQPDAVSEEWTQFLDQVTGGNAEYQGLLQRIAGYAMLGSPVEQLAFLVHGRGATGKTTFVAALQTPLAEYCHTLNSETLLKRNNSSSTVMYDLAELRGKRLAIASEVDDGRVLAEGIFKAITGGDTISARLPYGRFQNAAPLCTLFLQCNHVPRIRHDDDAMWRRIIRLPFDQVVPKAQRDPNLRKRLTDLITTAPAVLAWMVRGALEYQRIGLSVPAFIAESTAELREEMDTVREFIEERCELNPGFWVTSQDLAKAYKDWAFLRDETPLSPKSLAAGLVEHGAAPTKRQDSDGRQVRGYKGIGLLPGVVATRNITDEDMARMNQKLMEKPRRIPSAA